MQVVGHVGLASYTPTPFGSAAAQACHLDAQQSSRLGGPFSTLAGCCGTYSGSFNPNLADSSLPCEEAARSQSDESDSDDVPLSGSLDSSSYNVYVKLEEQNDPVGALAPVDYSAYVKDENVLLPKEEQNFGYSQKGASSCLGLARSFVAPNGVAYGMLHPADAAVIFRSQYRGVSYDKKKRKWRVQIKVASLGKSGVSVGYFDTEEAAARAYDKAAIGLLGKDQCRSILNFPIDDYDMNKVPQLVGKTREEVKATLKNERAKIPRRRLTHRRRTSRYLGVGSSNRKNQWQARILYHGKVTHLGYYRTEEEAARVYDRVSISLHGEHAQTNFPVEQYAADADLLRGQLAGLSREELQRSLGVKPMDKSSQYRGVSKKKGKWEAKVMLNRKWAYRELFDTEAEAAHAYDAAVWRLKPREARSYVNFKNSCPADVAALLQGADGADVGVTPQGIPLTAQPLLEAGLLFREEGQGSVEASPVSSSPYLCTQQPPQPRLLPPRQEEKLVLPPAPEKHQQQQMARSFSHSLLPPQAPMGGSIFAQPGPQMALSRQLSLPTRLPSSNALHIPVHSVAPPGASPPGLLLPSYLVNSSKAPAPLTRLHSLSSSTSSTTNTFISASPLSSPSSSLPSSPALQTAPPPRSQPAPLLVRVGSETHLIPAHPQLNLHHAPSTGHLPQLATSPYSTLHTAPALSAIDELRVPSLQPTPALALPSGPPSAPAAVSWLPPSSYPSGPLSSSSTSSTTSLHALPSPLFLQSQQPSSLPSSFPPHLTWTSAPFTCHTAPMPTSAPTTLCPLLTTWPQQPPASVPSPTLPTLLPTTTAPTLGPLFPAGPSQELLGGEADMMDITPCGLMDLLPDFLEPDLHHDLFPGDDLQEAYDHHLPSPPSSPHATPNLLHSP